jgi:cysteine desulfurase
VVANNLFVKGAAGMRRAQQVVVGAAEHPCVIEPARDLSRAGWTVRELAVDPRGVYDLDDLSRALAQPTGLVCTMLAHNDTGVLQPVAAIAQRARAAGAWVHTDAVQALGKIPVDFAGLGVHAMSLSAHKLGGPKGAGALVLDKRIELRPLLHGGGHESGMRSGTENVPAIVGFGAACERVQSRIALQSTHCRALRDDVESRLHALGAVVFGEGAPRLPNTTFFAIEGLDGETLVIELDRVGYGVASGSACSSHSTEPSATLLAMGVDPSLARCAVRVSLGPETTAQQVAGFGEALAAVVARLRSLTAMVA